MQSGIDTSRARIVAEIPSSGPEQLAVAYPTQTAASAAIVKPVAANSPSTTTEKGFFGPEGPSFRDALDAINPLNHIPIVSDILANLTGHEPSTASKLAGGAIFGPIGFVASLASVIFEDIAGGTPVMATYAALNSSEETAVQLAKVDTAVESVEATELASLETATGSNVQTLADLNTRGNAVIAAPTSASTAVLDLYGASASSAHASYKKAQLLPYLRDVNHSSVL